MRIDQKILIHCTDTDKDAEGTILRIYKGSIDVKISDMIIKMHQQKSNLYVGSMHGLEFTALLKL